MTLRTDHHLVHGKPMSDEQQETMHAVAQAVFSCAHINLQVADMCACPSCLTHVLTRAFYGVIENVAPEDALVLLRAVRKANAEIYRHARSQAKFDEAVTATGAQYAAQQQPS